MHAKILTLKPKLATAVKLQTGADLAPTEYFKVLERPIVKDELNLHKQLLFVGTELTQWTSLVPRPHPARVSLPASILKAIRAKVGFGSGTETNSGPGPGLEQLGLDSCGTSCVVTIHSLPSLFE